jgi:hypothetical protein
VGETGDFAMEALPTNLKLVRFQAFLHVCGGKLTTSTAYAQPEKQKGLGYNR